VFILVVSGVAGLLLLAAAGLCKPPDYLRWLILLACIGELVMRSVVWVQTVSASELVIIDPGLYTDLSGELLLRGENPYAWDLAGAFDLCRTDYSGSTPKLNAAYARDYPYPALPFLLTAPFQALNLPGIFLVSVAAHATVLALLFLAAPRSIQPLILIPLVIGLDFTSLTLIGSVDVVWAALLVGVVVAWRRPTLRAVLFGLAAAFKQGPWLVIPFLLIRIWRDKSDGSPIRRVVHFLAISGVAFLVINGPFIVWNPEAWLRGVSQPLRDDSIFFSQGGLSTLTQFGLVYLPKNYYLFAMLSVFGLLLFCYWRHYDALRDTCWIVPGIFMWFSYRSLISYWAYWVFPLLATLATRTPPDKESASKPALGPTLAVASTVLGVLIIVGIWLSFSSAAVEVRPNLPLRTVQGRITGMSVQVVNRSRRTLTPRFALQHRYTTGNPLPWYIDQGPRSLSPGQAAVYHISTERRDRIFFAHDTAQLVVTDAGGDYSLRGVATIQADSSFLWPDAIPNPMYRFWDSGLGAPIFWGLVADPPGSGAVSPGNKAGRGALTLTLDADGKGLNRVALESVVTFPLHPFGIWVYSEPPAENLSSVAYGLEIDDGEHQLWILFGPQEYTGPLEDGQYIINYTVPSRRWVYQEIDLLTAYVEAGWQLPALKPAIYRELDMDFRLVHLRLLLAADGPADNLQATFGPIEQDNYRVEPQTLMAEALDDPTSYYIRLAESYTRERNYSRALEAYRRALHYSPGDSQALDGMKRVRQRLAGESSQ
jgi:hypothetical protein